MSTPIILDTDIGTDVAMKLPVAHRSAISPTTETTGAIDAMAVYAGESVASVTRVQPAAEIVRELSEGAEKLLRMVSGNR